MKNKNTLDFFQKMADDNPDEKSVKINKTNDFTDFDAKLILQYAKSNSKILDLASGTGLIINKIYKKVKKIIAIEAFPEFSKFITTSPKIDVINLDISHYTTKGKFDLITMFGIVQYFNEEEIKRIYLKYRANLKAKGKLIVKGQFGVHEDVLISGYSKELKTNYYSHYRQLAREIVILKQLGYKNIKSIDIYPPECNRWDNTHFYAIVAEKDSTIDL